MCNSLKINQSFLWKELSLLNLLFTNLNGVIPENICTTPKMVSILLPTLALRILKMGYPPHALVTT